LTFELIDMKTEIISIGTEIMLGEITDTNASFLASQLPALGNELLGVSQVGDDMGRMLEVLKRAWQRSQLILTTGGLGPTGDDLTREAVAALLGEEMRADPSLEQALRERFGRMTVQMSPTNLKQATLIPSAKAIPNPNGTAPGWLVERDGRILVTMPGPPAEMQPMWKDRVAPYLSRLASEVIVSRTIKTTGLPEATVGEMVAPMFASTNPVFGIYARPDGIHLRMAARAPTRPEAETMLADGEARVRAVLSQYIWGADGDAIGAVAGRLLLEKGQTLSAMEDYTGGMLSTTILEVPDSSKFFSGGLVAATDRAKAAFGVSSEVATMYGSSSAEMAKAMAEAARTVLKADIGLSCSAAAVTTERPTGVVYAGIADSRGSQAIPVSRRKQVIVSSILFQLRQFLLAR
jgi:nicotinamide-nucleotide amidase